MNPNRPAATEPRVPSPNLFERGMCLFVLVAICAVPFSARADYPLVSHKFSADPTGLEFNGRLYLYCSNDTDNDTNGGYTMHSITCISSDCLLYTSDAADDLLCVDLGGRRII